MPIINPWFFYLIELSKKIEYLSDFIFGGIIAIIVFNALARFLYSADWIFTKKIFKCVAILAVIYCVVMVIIPSKETMYKMFVSQNVTNENFEIASEAIKYSVDYIIEKMNE